MKKLLYIAPVEINLETADGVLKKILQQVDAFNKYLDVYLIGYQKKDIALYKNGKINIITPAKKAIHRRMDLYTCSQNFVEKMLVDKVYIRYGYSEWKFIDLLKNISEVADKIIIEIPTYPYKGEATKSFKKKITYYIDQLYARKLKKYTSGIATFSNHKKIFSIPCIKIMNGIDVDRVSIKRHINSTTLNLLAIASMASWHAYDRIIEGMNDYYKDGGNQQIVLHLVGNGEEIPKYKQLVQKYNLQNNITFHGFKSGDELDKLYDKCDIAIASLGMHRINLFLASTLKSREYGAKGMPMVTSCEIDAFPTRECDYVLKVPEDESHIDINQIIDFYSKLIYKYADSKALAQQIRNDTKERCDMAIVMKPVIEYLNL
ncbi:MAG: glycosyltransferase [Lachnospiraceae bacterium]